ncbi:MAG: hypothetical protein RL641_749 [Candidatus Parcubacteria bacterium]|jgi:hypothetical protein
MQSIKFSELAVSPYSDNAIVRNDFPGFREDYLAIHSLIRKYQPKTLMEIGTSSGSGTTVICHAMGVKKNWWNSNKYVNALLVSIGMKSKFRKNKNESKKVFSIDVPPGTDPSVIYPGAEDGHPLLTGRNCYFPYTQLFGNSTTFDFTPYYPLESWFVDGKHNYEYAHADTM